MEKIVARVQNATGLAHSPKFALETAILASCTSSNDLFDYFLPKHLRRTIGDAAESIGLSVAEFVAVATHPNARRAGAADALVALESEEHVTVLRCRLENALRQTLAETSQAKTWTSPRVRVAAILALHRERGFLEALNALLGEIVRSDLRRIEDLREDLLEEGIDVFLIVNSTRALAAPLF